MPLNTIYDFARGVPDRLHTRIRQVPMFSLARPVKVLRKSTRSCSKPELDSSREVTREGLAGREPIQHGLAMVW